MQDSQDFSFDVPPCFEPQPARGIAVISSKLEFYGYQLFQEVFDGNDFGVFEGWSRLVLVATSRGLETDQLEGKGED